MRAHCLQHVSFEDMGAIETWLIKNHFSITTTHFYTSDLLPDLNDFDWVIIMGGSMSVNDEKEFPWLVTEKEFIRKCIGANKVVIGICLGSQLIASALGCKVYRNEKKEIGWFPISKIQNAKSVLFKDFPNILPVFHWHGETFALPAGAELIASSKTCINQIFTVGNKVIGMQCHLETTFPSLTTLNDQCKAELIHDTYVQSEQEMKENAEIYITGMHKALFTVLDNILHQ